MAGTTSGDAQFPASYSATPFTDNPAHPLQKSNPKGLQDELIRIRQATGKTILFVTHDIDEAVYLADRIVALGGKPGEVRAVRTIDVPRPRKRGAWALSEISQAIKAEIAAEAAAAREDWVI